MSSLSSGPVSMEKHEAVINDFLGAIEEFVTIDDELGVWVKGGRQGTRPIDRDPIGDTNRHYVQMGMSPSLLMTLREVAFNIHEAVDEQKRQGVANDQKTNS